MNTRDLNVGDVLINIKGQRFIVKSSFSRDRGIEVQHQLTGNRHTIFQEQLSLAWRYVERDGVTIDLDKLEGK